MALDHRTCLLSNVKGESCVKLPDDINSHLYLFDIKRIFYDIYKYCFFFSENICCDTLMRIRQNICNGTPTNGHLSTTAISKQQPVLYISKVQFYYIVDLFIADISYNCQLNAISRVALVGWFYGEV